MSERKYDLHFLIGSAWSVRVMWAFTLLPKSVQDQVNVKPVQQANSLKSKVAKATLYDDATIMEYNAVSVPMLFFTDDAGQLRMIREGVEIIIFLSKLAMKEEKENGKVEFCKNTVDMKDEVTKWNDDLSLIMRYMRGVAATADYRVTDYILPQYIVAIPGVSRFLSYMIRSRLSSKYGKGDTAIKIEDLETLLGDANSILEKNEYLIENKLSYADIILGTVIEIYIPLQIEKPISYGALLLSTSVETEKERKWKEKFPNVFAHRDRMMEKHMPDQIFDFGVKLTKKIEVPK